MNADGGGVAAEVIQSLMGKIDDREVSLILDINPIKVISSEFMASIIDTLKRTTRRITFLNIDVGRPGQNASATLELFDAIGNLPHLTNLNWTGGEMLHLGTVLQRARNLQKFSGQVSFDGPDGHFLEFAESIKNHPSLEDADFSSCEIRARGSKRLSNINPIIASLATIPNLASIRLGCWDPPYEKNETKSNLAPVVSLLKRPKLVCFSSLRTLSTTKLMPSQYASIGYSTCLKRLSLGLPLSEENCREFGNAIRANKSITSLTLDVQGVEGATGRITNIGCGNLDAVTTVVGDHTRIERFRIICRGNWESHKVALETSLASMAKRSLSLQSVRYDDALLTSQSIQLSMDRWLQQNKDAKALVKDTSASRSHWIDTVVSSSERLSMVFHLLSKNPSLCDVAPIFQGRGSLVPRDEQYAPSSASSNKRLRMPNA